MDKWRKKESYIAVGRFLLDSPSGYKQWDCFLFRDYSERASLGRTFEVRHLPLSDGNDEKNFGAGFQFDWKKHAWSPVQFKSRSQPVVKSEPIPMSQTEETTDVPMIFDVELGKLVPIDY